jgi:hypothetical protein
MIMAGTHFTGPVYSANGFVGDLTGSVTGVLAGVTALTDNSGGTASDTIADVPATYTEATLADQIASLTAKINEIITALS